jgi:DNA-binding NtrC family response regulator
MKATPAILVVDDENDHCLNLVDILSEADYAVDVANDGATALGLISSRPYSAVLLDLVMPGMDGLSVFRGMKGLYPRLPACFITANGHTKIADEIRRTRCGPILTKPLDIPSLLNWIDGIVGRRMRTREMCEDEPFAGAS